MDVAERAAGGGYTAVLLALGVGPSVKVDAHNCAFILERFAVVPWSERLKMPVMATVQRIDSEFDSPLPTELRDLDAVFLVLFYHDMVWMKTDRAKFNRAIFDALAPGGTFVIVDHSARAGDGVTQAETLHRIEESVVVAEVTGAGFILDQSSDFLREPTDARDWNASPRAAAERRGQSDRFALRFVKPASPE
jgi:predicted methyltransferase